MKSLSAVALVGALALATTAAFAQAPAPGNSTQTDPKAADTPKTNAATPAQDTKGKVSAGSESKSTGNASMSAPSAPTTGKVDARGLETPTTAQAPNKMSDGKMKKDSTVGAGSTDPATRGQGNDKQNKAQ